MYTTLAPPLPCDAPYLYSPRLEGVPLTTAIHIAWHPPFANGDPISSYELETDGVSVTVQYTQFLHFGLRPGTRHTYRLAATNSLGSGNQSALFETTTANGPAAKPEPPIPAFVERGGRQYIQMNLQPAAYSGVFGEGVLHYQLKEVGHALRSSAPSSFGASPCVF
jgi:hypothetical protein